MAKKKITITITESEDGNVSLNTIFSPNMGVLFIDEAEGQRSLTTLGSVYAIILKTIQDNGIIQNTEVQ